MASTEATRRYRIEPWPVRILMPVVVGAFVIQIVSSRTAPAVLVPVVLVLGAAYVYATERCGLYVSDWGLESKMARRGNSFRYPWAEIDGFTIIAGGAQLAIVLHLVDGGEVVLPSTKAWTYNRSAVEEICEGLNSALDLARKH